MIDVKHKRCITHLCDVRPVHKYKGHCLRCFIYEFPDEKVARNYKTKEIYVADHVKEQFKEYDWVCDKSVQGGCSRKRPDMLVHMGSHVIIIEIDENQHSVYDNSCESNRLMLLYKDLNYSPIVFIRFNPDTYVEKGIKHLSCWAANKNGIMTVKKNSVTEWTHRLKVLCDNILMHSKEVPLKSITVESLFFNDVE
jgi:hypothetical protein